MSDMTNQDRAEYGRSALRAGDPDFYGSDNETSLTDTLANLMHWAHENGVTFTACVQSAAMHFEAER